MRHPIGCRTGSLRGRLLNHDETGTNHQLPTGLVYPEPPEIATPATGAPALSVKKASQVPQRSLEKAKGKTGHFPSVSAEGKPFSQLLGVFHGRSLRSSPPVRQPVKARPTPAKASQSTHFRRQEFIARIKPF